MEHNIFVSAAMLAGFVALPIAASICHPFVLAPAVAVAFSVRRYWRAALGGVLAGVFAAGIVTIFHRPGMTFILLPPPRMAWSLFPVAGFMIASICYPLARAIAAFKARRGGEESAQ